MKLVLQIAGVLCVLLAIIGVCLPLLPTTPFLLLAAACFARSSKTMHDWLTSHRLLGPYLRNYEAGRGIPVRAKAVALVMMWSSLSFAFWRFDLPWLRLLLLVIGTGVTIYLWRMPSYITPPRAANDESYR